jgi:hypothetical protein
MAIIENAEAQRFQWGVGSGFGRSLSSRTPIARASRLEAGANYFRAGNSQGMVSAACPVNNTAQQQQRSDGEHEPVGKKQHQDPSVLQHMPPHTVLQDAETRNVCAQNTNGALNEIKPHRKVDSCTVGLVWRAHGAASFGAEARRPIDGGNTQACTHAQCPDAGTPCKPARL